MASDADATYDDDVEIKAGRADPDRDVGREPWAVDWRATIACPRPQVPAIRRR